MPANPSSDKGYTIAEAAEQLGVPKKTLRHILTRPDRKARLLREYRTTKKGLVTVEIVPHDLYDEIAGSGPAADVTTDAPVTVHEIATETAQSELPGGDAVFSAAAEPVEPIEAAESGGADEPAKQAETAPTEPQPAAVPDAGSANVIEAVLQSAPALQTNATDTMLIVATYERLLAEKEGRLTDLRSALEAERETCRRLADALAREQELRVVAPPAAEPPRRSLWARLMGR
ncbi:MAG TPA: hypothetical protein VGK19_21480 [Capsulimonadaceae bacterium]|jgi:hypothetical protein